jgi:alpha-D-glucose phosphate-specific phosphoglucomutase
MAIKFGTDGWRAVISEEFTFANVRHVARAIAAYLLQTRADPSAPVVVGFDTRFLSDRYALEVSQVLADGGLTVYLSKCDCPTPALAFAIWQWKALGGIMITASHNPPRYNGIKFKGPHGGPGLPSETQRIEEILEDGLARGALATDDTRLLSDLDKDYPGIARFDPMPAYLDHVRRLVDLKAISTSGLRVVVDPMYGAGRGYVASFLREAGCAVTELHGDMNPGFGGIHPEPIERNLSDLLAVMRDGPYDLGLASDGDADRIGAVDATGSFVDPHRIFSLLLRHLVEERQLRGAVVKTVSTTQLLNRLSQHYGLPLHETPVGFNHICEWMLKEDVLIGGEESGGITIKGHIPDGDGILMGLLLAELLAYQRRPLHEIVAQLMQDFGEFHYGRKDVRTHAFDKMELTRQLLQEAPDSILNHHVMRINNSDGVKYLLDDDGWLLIRPSGTEPLLRIYAEARTAEEVPHLLAAGAGLAHI